MPVPADERAPLMRYLRVQQITEKEIRVLLRRAARDLATQIENLAPTGYGDSVRLAQLRLRHRAILEELWLRTGDSISRGKTRAVAAATVGGDADLRSLLRGIPAATRAVLIEGAERAARDAVERAIARTAGREARELSERVYRNRELARGTVDRLINSALARGLSPAEMAREVWRYILPSTPGGASYAAMRLGRTEVNNSFHAATVAYYEDSPFVQGQQWKLSGSHPKPDTCDDYARRDEYRLGPGVFPRDGVPRKPHPHCFCYTIPVTPDDDQVVASYLRGDYDDFLAGQGITAVDPAQARRPLGR